MVGERSGAWAPGIRRARLGATGRFSHPMVLELLIPASERLPETWCMSSRHLQRGRFSCPGSVYVLTTVTRARRPLFDRASNAEIVVECLRDIERAGISHTFAWVVMPDHVHWLLQLRQGTLGACMQRFTQQPADRSSGRIRVTAMAAQLLRARAAVGRIAAQAGALHRGQSRKSGSCRSTGCLSLCLVPLAHGSVTRSDR